MGKYLCLLEVVAGIEDCTLNTAHCVTTPIPPKTLCIMHSLDFCEPWCFRQSITYIYMQFTYVHMVYIMQS
jgi:hypothetical protein